jgi:hypothetical protein
MLLFMLLAATITVSSMISTVVSVHLLSILRARGIALAAAVALGALIGPAQVGARAIEMLISRYHHPIWTMVASTIFVAFGVGAHRVDRARHAAAGPVRRGSIARNHGPDRHAEPHCAGSLALAWCRAHGTG